MESFPSIPGGAMGYGSSPLMQRPQPSASDLLMSAAEMHRSGAMERFKQPNPVHPQSVRKKLKVIK